MRMQLLLSILFFAGSDCLLAQRNNSYKNIENYNIGYSLRLHIGSQGFGISAAYEPTEVFAFRVGTSLAPVGLTQTRNWSNNNYTVDMKAKFYNVQTVVEVKPFRITNNMIFIQQLALVGGIGYFFKSEAKAKATPRDNYNYGEIIIPKENLGSVSTKIIWKGLAPYLGAAIRNIYISEHMELNLDAGTYFLSTPDVTITADKMLSGNAASQSTVEHNMKGYRWLPVIQVGLSYRL